MTIQEFKEFISKKSNLFVWFSLLAISLLYYFYAFGRPDLIMSDDFTYINIAYYTKLPYLDASYGNFFYPMSFLLISKFVSNPMTVYFIAAFLNAIFAYVLLYFFLKKMVGSRLVSFMVATLFLFSEYQMSLQPRVTYLALIAGLSYLILIKPSMPRYLKFTITTIGLIVITYIRPEFFLIFVLSFGLWLYFTVREKELPVVSKTVVLAGVFCLLSFIFYMAGGVPTSGRLKDAFIQHFFDNYTTWYGVSYGYYEEFEVFDTIYGVVNKPLDLVTVNPEFFVKHVFSNIVNYFVTVFKILKSIFYDLVIPFTGAGKFTRYIITGLFAVFIYFTDLKQTYQNFIRGLGVLKENRIFLALFFLPPFFSVFIIYPRYHYILLHLPAYFFLIALALKSISFKKQEVLTYARIPLIVFYLIVAIPEHRYPENRLAHNEYYEYLRNMESETPINMLNNDFFGVIYLRGKIDDRFFLTKKDSINEVINKNKTSLVIFNEDDLRRSDVQSFINGGYKKFGLSRIDKFQAINEYVFFDPARISIGKAEHLYHRTL